MKFHSDQLSSRRQKRRLGYDSNRRGAALFALVISVSLLVSVLGMTSLVLMRIERQNVSREHDVILAKRHAHSAVELGLSRISQYSDWRTRYANGVWETVSINNANDVSIVGIDPVDGRLDDDTSESVKIIGTGTVGKARQKESVVLDFKYSPLDCLETGIASGNDIVITNATVQSDIVIASKDDVYNYSGNVYADVEAVDLIGGATYHGEQSPGSSARQLPDRQSVFNHYWQTGTQISLILFPYRNGAFWIENLSFDPTTNPVSLVGNSKGVYAIYCYGYNVVINNSQFTGTLFLYNAGTGTRVTGNSVFEPAESGYPSLLVDGDLTIDLSSDGVLGGIVYSSDDVSISRLPQLNGTLVAHDRVDINGPVNIVHRRDFVINPPPGFREPEGVMKIRPGSWRREVD